MSRARARLWTWPRTVVVVALFATGCTPPPVIRPPDPEPPVIPPRFSDNAQRQAEARHRKLAQDATRAGDFATAVTQWHIVTLLAPADASSREALAAARTSRARGVSEQMAAAKMALAANDFERAAQAAVRAMALDPEHADAAQMLRELDRRRMARIQADRAARVRVEDAIALRNAAQNQANATEGSPTFEMDQAVELFRAGDSIAGLREMRAYVDAHPNNRGARQRAGQAVAERARELEDKGARSEALDLYDQAIALYGDKPPFAARAAALRKAPPAAPAKGKP
ncbi:MAG: hypothetical protein ABIO63_10645 [Casimicrobiaceae bacterium]